MFFHKYIILEMVFNLNKYKLIPKSKYISTKCWIIFKLSFSGSQIYYIDLFSHILRYLIFTKLLKKMFSFLLSLKWLTIHLLGLTMWYALDVFEQDLPLYINYLMLYVYYINYIIIIFKTFNLHIT